MPEKNPYFEFEGLRFRTVEDEDLEWIRRLRNESTTWVNLTDPRPLSAADQKAWISGLGIRSSKFYFIAYDEMHPYIGLVRMDEYDGLNRSIRVGADVSPELRRQGHGGRIYAAIKKICFDILNTNRVWLLVLETNETAAALYRRQGFTVEGKMRQAVFRNGKYVDYVMMSILELEYRRPIVGGSSSP